MELAPIVTGRKRRRSGDGFGDEIERITIGLHRLMQSRRTSVMVLDRCAGEIPELAAVWFGDGRYALVDLWQDYLGLRANHVTADVDRAILARTIVEIITTWAVKLPWDPAPRPYPADTATACAATYVLGFRATRSVTALDLDWQPPRRSGRGRLLDADCAAPGRVPNLTLIRVGAASKRLPAE